MTPAQWFDHIYRYVDTGWISLFTFDRQAGDKRVEWAKIGETDALVLSDDRCIWFGVATRRANLGPVRGGTADCAQIPALWVDIDVAGDAHAQSELPPDMASALQLLDDYPVEPTCVIRTGNGLQAWWQFAEPLEVDEAVPLLARWGTTWTQLANRRGWHIDNVWDVARVMRVPGTYNTKTDARPLVTVERADWSRTFCVDDFEAHLLEAPPQTRPTRNGLPYVGPQRPGDAYNAVTDPGDLLNAVGCHFDKQDANGDRHWRAPHHPGANEGSGITVYADHTTIYSQTFARTYGLETGRPYDPFALYTFLFHGGVWAEASAALRARGFGSDEFQTTEETVTNEDEWPEPIPLVDDAEVPGFPLEALPQWAVAYSEALADDIQVSVDLPAAIALGALSVAALGNAKVYYKRANWTQPLNLFITVALPPSAGKSPVKAAMFAPLQEIETARIEAAVAKTISHESEKRSIEKALRSAEDRLAKAYETNNHPAIADAGRVKDDLVAKTVSLARPKSGKLLLDDVTTEALGMELADAGGAIAVVTAEGGIFDRIAGLYNNQQANMDLYLEGWGGGSYSVSRVGRPPIRIPSANIAVVATVQIAVLDAIGARKDFAGRGLTARFLTSIPASKVGRRDRMAQAVVNDAVRDEYSMRLKEFATRLESVPNGVTVTIDGEAGELFARWDQRTEDGLRPGGDLEHLKEFVGKLRASVLRVAALLHLAEMDHGEENLDVSSSTMARALTLGDYYLAHAKAIEGRWGADGRTVAAQAILEWLQRTEAAEFTVRDLYRTHRRHFPTVEDTRGPLEVLVDKGWIRPLFEGPLVLGRRGKESPRFAVFGRTTSDMGRQLDTKNGSQASDMRDMSAMTPQLASHVLMAQDVFLEGTHSLTFRERTGTLGHEGHEGQLVVNAMPHLSTAPPPETLDDLLFN